MTKARQAHPMYKHIINIKLIKTIAQSWALCQPPVLVSVFFFLHRQRPCRNYGKKQQLNYVRWINKSEEGDRQSIGLTAKQRSLIKFKFLSSHQNFPLLSFLIHFGYYLERLSKSRTKKRNICLFFLFCVTQMFFYKPKIIFMSSSSCNDKWSVIGKVVLRKLMLHLE